MPHFIVTSPVDQWLKNTNDNKYCGALFIDLKKAFDAIDHDPLIRKLSPHRLSASTLKLINPYSTNRQQRVTANTTTSAQKTLKHGVPQGSASGPPLLTPYTNDLPLHAQADSEPSADDTTIHTSHANKNQLTPSPQESAYTLNKWTEQNHNYGNPSPKKQNSRPQQPDKNDKISDESLPPFTSITTLLMMKSMTIERWEQP
jgi:hypothetical protein